MAQAHLIGKQVIELQLANHEQAFQWQNRFSQLYWRTLTPALERLFDRLTPENELIRINKLEVDLGSITYKNLDADAFITHFIAEVEKAIQAQVNYASPNVVHLTPPRNDFQLWLYFLEYGYLPAYVAMPGAAWQRNILDTLGLETTAIDQLRTLLFTKTVAFDRLILQHKVYFLQHIAELFTGIKQTTLTLILAELQEAALLQAVPARLIRQLQVYFWKFVLRQLLLQKNKATADTVITELLKTWLPPLKATVLSKPAAFPQLISILEKNKNWIETVSSTQSASLPEKFDSDTAATELSKQTSITEQKNDLPPQANEGFYIPHAGLILLHPFLARFFAKLEITTDYEFSSPWHQQKAVCLLQFLTSGALQTPEFNLMLPKFLCGMPLNMPIDPMIEITPEEQSEAETLLEAAIEHWGALGDVSFDSLREGFLQREGKLSHQSTGWRLQVEQNTIDILLDRLPWNLSLIKLPWMEDLLKVEWR